ncbi:PREDICTED: deoxyribonuclease-1-like [Amphimedon queenslandica]|uniref:Deoxyribonuclease n=1 Tax=Amphimedon queenslandica TaxID=400682 RepID=A0A1X7VTY9_AMPQE|nr:PREDICTED: deoxyribonuclease-1-like [Amphimedon queenslandica]|eukprot:XP_019851574.1 PREDICTED: deoxyribonuclease-1-like [Amphimedon queenslandica]
MYKAALVSLAILFGLCNGQGLNVLSFNVRQFGRSKYSDQEVVNTLIEIVRGYDLILIIELVDVSQTVLPGFASQLNEAVASSGIRYNYSVSERVGRSHVKEQYVFLYKTSEIQILDSYQYPDNSDMFERPPYSVLVRTLNRNHGNIPPFFLIASHTKPTDAPEEINHLDNVFEATSSAFSTSNGAILGDLNAGCSYLSRTRYNTLDLVVNTSFTWWIGYDTDTTTGTTNCAYDRIITWSSLTPYIVNGSASVVLFDNQYQLSSQQTAAVSDHYPISISLKGEVADSAFTVNSAPLLVIVLVLIGALLLY